MATVRMGQWAGVAASLGLLAVSPAVGSGFRGGAVAVAGVAVAPAIMPRVGSVDERFQSFNIEMVEVTGGRFWAPYKASATAPAADPGAKTAIPAGMEPSLYRYRKPIDLTNPKLRKMAAALAPAYVRGRGTWANSTYFQDSGGRAPATPRAGF